MTKWRSAYVIVANTALLIMFVEVGAHALLTSHQAWSHRVEQRRANQALRTACATLRFRYGVGAGFLHDARTSALVNIDEYGIRSNGGPARPIGAIDNATWMFGGSTVFGCEVADGDTIAAQLERLKSEPVINLGVRGHNSAMENRLFSHYLLAGYRPRRALFLEGVEESCANGLFDSRMAAIANAMQQDYSWGFGVPIRSAISSLGLWWNRQPATEEPNPAPTSVACNDEGRQQTLATIVTRRLAERAALCRLYRVECHTLVLPEPHSDLIEHLTPSWRDAGATFVGRTSDIASTISQHLGPHPAVTR
jgi:hypothetical protein